MDLEERARAFLAAGAAAAPGAEGFLAGGAAFEVEGRRVERAQFLRALAGLGPVREVAVKRNVTFAWTAGGVLVLSWNQDGRVAHAALYAAPA